MIYLDVNDPPAIISELGGSSAFLSTPFNSPSREVMRKRRDHAADLALYLLRSCGVAAYAPVPYGVAISGELIVTPETEEAWVIHGLAMLRSLQFFVLTDFPGYERSSGMQAELDHAKAHKKKIVQLTGCDGAWEPPH